MSALLLFLYASVRRFWIRLTRLRTPKKRAPEFKWDGSLSMAPFLFAAVSIAAVASFLVAGVNVSHERADATLLELRAERDRLNRLHDDLRLLQANTDRIEDYLATQEARK